MHALPLQSVLYVDDEPDIREIVQVALGLNGTFAVRTADSGEQALLLARSLLPDLVLLDVMMPGLDGPTTLGRLRADPATAAIPVAFMTAKAMPAEVAMLHEMGAAGVIAKPFDPISLSAQVIDLWKGCRTGASSDVRNGEKSGLRQRVTQLGDRFLQRTKDEVLRLKSLVEHLQPGDAGTIAELEQIAHRIHGSGSTFGFPALSQCAEDIEQLVGGLRQRGNTAASVFDSNTRLRLTECTQRLAMAVESAALG
jgi:CheY-like chemotaxis protein